MLLSIIKADKFRADFEKYFAWYVREAGEDVAWRFQTAMEGALERISKLPGVGNPCRLCHPDLKDLRAFRVDPPFHRILVFYRIGKENIEAWRLMHGARDLSRRLLEPPADD